MAEQGKDFPCGDESSRPGTGRDDRSERITGGSDDNLLACYAVLQIGPAASLEEISAAYHRLKNTWREDRFLQVDAWQDKSKVKLAEIEKAYDTVLKSLLQHSPDLPPEPDLSGDDPTLALPEEGIPFQREDPFLATPEGESPFPADDKPAFAEAVRGKGPLSRRRTVLAALLLMLVIVAGGLLVWPTLYRYDVIRSGDKVVHLRINRLTSATTDIDGNRWVPPPPDEPSGKAPLAVDPAPLPPAVKAPPAGTVAGEPVVMSIPVPAGQKSETHRDIPAPKAEDATPGKGIAAPALSAAPPAPKAKPPLPAPKDEALKGGEYSIQVKAFREEAKARDFLKGVKARHADARLQKAAIKGKGIWYRVFIGHYRSRDQALADLKKKGIAEAYPGSFVQRAGKGT